MSLSTKTLISLLIGLPLLVSLGNGQTTPKTVVFNEMRLRFRAKTVVFPQYPSDLAREKVSGVCVAKLEFDENGLVANIEILQSPHDSVSSEMKKALEKWTFTPINANGEPRNVQGKITFYFMLKDGKGIVENPISVTQLLEKIEKAKQQKSNLNDENK